MDDVTKLAEECWQWWRNQDQETMYSKELAARDAFIAGWNKREEVASGDSFEGYNKWSKSYFGHGMTPSQSYFESTMSAYQAARIYADKEIKELKEIMEKMDIQKGLFEELKKDLDWALNSITGGCYLNPIDSEPYDKNKALEIKAKWGL